MKDAEADGTCFAFSLFFFLPMSRNLHSGIAEFATVGTKGWEMPILGTSPMPFLPTLVSVEVILMILSYAIFSTEFMSHSLYWRNGAPGLSRS